MTCGSSKSDFLETYSNFIDVLDQRDTDSEKDWKASDDIFETYIVECYDHFENKMSSSEKRTFWINSLKYYAARYGSGMIQELANENNPTSVKMTHHLEEVAEESGLELEAFLKTNLSELEKILIGFSRDLEEWAKKLKEHFDEN